jgi:hypothetical protein
MRPRGHLPKPAVFSRRLLSLAVRSVAIASMSFAAAFGFLSGATSPGAHYDPHTFAIGVSACSVPPAAALASSFRASAR